MKLNIKPGTYIIAVSGGIDSVVLLDILSQIHDSRFIVAHYDHGIRVDSGEDRMFVASLAEKYGLPFYSEEGKLGASASEALARDKRYAFLRKIMGQTNADAIITAHHEDDALETMILNYMRGTGRRGMGVLRSNNEIVRPLLSVSKAGDG